jgi:hypothetical protein
MPLFHRGSKIDAAQAISLAEEEARRRGWPWRHPAAEQRKGGWQVRLRPDELESPFVRLSLTGEVLQVGFEDRYLSDRGAWSES